TRSAATAQTQKLHGNIFEKILSILPPLDPSNARCTNNGCMESFCLRTTVAANRTVLVLQVKIAAYKTRRGLYRPQVPTHLLDIHRVLFHDGTESIKLLLLRLVPAVFFDELVEQHRIYRFVAYRVSLSLVVASHYFRIHFSTS